MSSMTVSGTCAGVSTRASMMPWTSGRALDFSVQAPSTLRIRPEARARTVRSPVPFPGESAVPWPAALAPLGAAPGTATLEAASRPSLLASCTASAGAGSGPEVGRLAT